MKTFLLIVYLHATSGQTSSALTSVDGFTSKERCETAATQVKQVVLKNNRYWLSKNSIGHSCIEIIK
ncbi:hypothetical protein [Photobacterium kasasachensis]|uniref:hypothetical protein n=1 Tax=Photobacterium kasasachensis TaxID=2910240 RepID=UPI003D147F10